MKRAMRQPVAKSPLPLSLRPLQPMVLQCHGASRTSPQRAAASALSGFTTQDLAANMVSSVVTLALRSRLRKCGKIDIRVDTDGLTLLSGQVRRAWAEGIDWQSPADLTARLLQFGMGAAAIDYGALVSQQRIVLRNIPRGEARILFNARDSGNFLVHPLMAGAAAKAVDGGPFLFDRDGVHLQLSPQPVAFFSGVAASDGKRYSVAMRPNSQHSAQHHHAGQADKGVVVTASAATAASPSASSVGSWDDLAEEKSFEAQARDAQVSQQLTKFFNQLLIDLQGVQLTFDALLLSNGSEPHGVREPVLDLRLAVRMVDFPPLNMQF